MSVDENKQIVRRAFDALSTGDLRPARELFTPDALIHQCGFLEPLPARALIDDAGTRDRFPGGGRIKEREIRLERMAGEGDLVALHWTVTGRYSAPDEPDVDGRPVSVPWMSFIRLDGGKIVELWNIRDTSTLQTQLHEGSDARRR
jgi:ketosteroid isomerase-like protein